MVAESNANTSLDWTFHFEHAERFDQAVGMILTNSVDILLLDLTLPDSSGLETVTKMLSVSSVPIIVMSGHDDETLALQAVQAGAQDYFVKGCIDSHGLERAVRYAVERKQIEAKLRESEEKYHQLFNMESDAIFLIENETGRILEANQAAVALYGFGWTELLKKRNTDLSAEPPKIRKVTMEGVTYVPIRYHRKKDGTVFPVEITARHCFWSGRSVHIAAIRDISKRLEAEESLREIEAKYRLVAENIPVVVYSALPDADSTIVFVSGKVNELTGYTGEEMLSDPKLWNMLIHPDDRTNVWTALKRHRAAKTLLDVEYRITTKDGRTLWTHDMAEPMLNEKGDITRINGFMEDITKRKGTEDALM